MSRSAVISMTRTASAVDEVAEATSRSRRSVQVVPGRRRPPRSTQSPWPRHHRRDLGTSVLTSAGNRPSGCREQLPYVNSVTSP